MYLKIDPDAEALAMQVASKFITRFCGGIIRT